MAKNREILKFKLSFESWQSISMPVDSKILSLQMQDNIPCLCVLIKRPLKNYVESRVIEMFFTGEGIEDETKDEPDRKFLGTVQHNGLVYHVFESGRSPDAP